VAAHDELSDRDAELIRAAEAVASWARARRATWTNARLDVVATPSVVQTPDADGDPTPPAAPSPVPGEPVPSRIHPPVSERIASLVRAVGAPGVRWLARAAVAATLGIAAFLGARYFWTAQPASTTKTPVVEPTEARPPGAARKATGGLRVGSTPAGARVLVDGRARGVTPLTLTDVSPGRHEITLESGAGTVHRSVTVAANETAEVEESIFSGWLAVYAPFEVVIAEGRRTLRPDERNQIMLPPGIHELRLANRALAYEEVRSVEVKPGETTNLQLTPQPSTLTVTASEAADVWIDGARAGETPLNAVPVSLGTHELVVKRAAGGERRFTVTIGANPFALNVDFQ